MYFQAHENELVIRRKKLTPSQLEIARKMALVLSPVEEVTKSISKETASLSVMIPNIRVLLRS